MLNLQKEVYTTDIVHKFCHWKAKPKGLGVEVEQDISLEISRSRVEYYRRLPRVVGEWGRYAEAEMPEVRILAREFQGLHSNQRWSTYNQALNVLKFVQTYIFYSSDKATTGNEDWTRYPIEKLSDGTGDCEDVAILCAATIARSGFQTVLLLYTSHLAFGVAGADHLKGDYVVDPATGKHHFYGEATSSGWRLGEIPANCRTIVPVGLFPVNIILAKNNHRNKE